MENRDIDDEEIVKPLKSIIRQATPRTLKSSKKIPKKKNEPFRSARRESGCTVLK